MSGDDFEVLTAAEAELRARAEKAEAERLDARQQRDAALRSRKFTMEERDIYEADCRRLRDGIQALTDEAEGWSRSTGSGGAYVSVARLRGLLSPTPDEPRP